MTRITLDTSRDIATVPLNTRILRTIDTPSGPATETSTGWFVAPYASLVNIGGQLQPNTGFTENAVNVASGREYMLSRVAQGHKLVHDGNRDIDWAATTDYWGGAPDIVKERYLSTTFFSTGYENDAFIFGGMGDDKVLQLSNAPSISTNGAGMAKWTTPNGSEQITFGVEEITFLDDTFSLDGIANAYQWTYAANNTDSFRVGQFNNLGDLSSNAIDFAYVHQDIGDWSTRATRVGEQWYYVEPGKTTAVNVPEYLIGQDTGYQFSSTGELLREIPWEYRTGTTNLSPPISLPLPGDATNPVTPTPPTFYQPAKPQPRFTSAATPSVAQASNTINITITGDGNTFGDIIIGVKNGRDRLRGTEGDDVITSNDGKDKLTGLAGADEFVIAGDGRDKVTDYDESEGDTLAVDKPLIKGIDSELVVVDSKPEFVATRDDSLVYREDTGKLYADGDLLAKLNGSPELSAVEVV